MQEEKKKLILVIDDNDFYHATAKLILKDTYNIITAQSGKEAIEYLQDGNNRLPDLILLDIVMPDMDGWLAYNSIRKIDTAKDIPVAIVSSVGGTTATNHAHSVGVADFISKPYNKNDLLERISKIIH